MNEAELLWLCGFLEGEGSFCVKHLRQYTYPYISAPSTDLDVLQRVQQIAGGTIRKQRLRPGRKPIWRWRLERKSEARALMLQVLPHMGARRSKRIIEILSVTTSEDLRKQGK